MSVATTSIYHGGRQMGATLEREEPAFYLIGDYVYARSRSRSAQPYQCIGNIDDVIAEASPRGEAFRSWYEAQRQREVRPRRVS